MENVEPVSAEILIVEDEVAHAEAINEALSRLGHGCTVVHDGGSAISRLRAQQFDVVVTNLMLGGLEDGMAVLNAANEHSPGTKVILVTAHSSVETCRAALQQGAFDYIEKPLDRTDLLAVGRAAEHAAQKRFFGELRQRLDEEHDFENIIGNSRQMLSVLNVIRRVAPSNIPVLILGESGTGKDLLAGAIHKNSPSIQERFVVVNCTGPGETFLKDDFFEDAEGARSGPATDRPGPFEYASGGTIFLDEVADLAPPMQAKLLRALKNREIIGPGAGEAIPVNTRIISAAKSDLADRVARNEFREDLYFRIKGVTIQIPPLRERREDIPALIDCFVKHANKTHGTHIRGIDSDARRVLMVHPWPGNVRQLHNVIENMVVLAAGAWLTVGDLPVEIYRRPQELLQAPFGQLAGLSLQEAEKELIRNTLKMVEGNRERAANLLRIGQRTLYRKIKEYDLKE